MWHHPQFSPFYWPSFFKLPFPSFLPFPPSFKFSLERKGVLGHRSFTASWRWWERWGAWPVLELLKKGTCGYLPYLEWGTKDSQALRLIRVSAYEKDIPNPNRRDFFYQIYSLWFLVPLVSCINYRECLVGPVRISLPERRLIFITKRSVKSLYCLKLKRGKGGSCESF